MALGALLTALLLGSLYLTMSRPARPQIVVHAPPTVSIGKDAAGAQAAVAAPTPAPSPTPATVNVFVSGAVARPGLYALPGGARVADALSAAGGLLPEAAQAAVNPAVVLPDEAQLYVPLASAVAPPNVSTDEATRGLVLDAGTLLGPPIDINAATRAELESLPHIGPAKAQAIIDNRPYTSVDELDRVPGIGPATLADLRPLVTVR